MAVSVDALSDTARCRIGANFRPLLAFRERSATQGTKCSVL